MYSRKYSLKTRYNFKRTLKYGKTFNSELLVIKYLRVRPEVFNEGEARKKFAIIASNKFSKKSVIQNKVKRVIGESIRVKLEKFPPFYYYIFIPKRTFLVEGKLDYDVEEIHSQIDTFLSKVSLS